MAAYCYDAYGNSLSGLEGISSSTFNSYCNSTAATKNTMGYCGEKYDTLSSTIYLRARFYAPGLHHFMQQDSYIGETGKPASRNTYAYCGGDPVNNCDPSGHWGRIIHRYIAEQALKNLKIKEKNRTTILDNSDLPDRERKKYNKGWHGKMSKKDAITKMKKAKKNKEYSN